MGEPTGLPTGTGGMPTGDQRPRAVDRGSWRSGQLLRVALDDGREFRFARDFSIGRADTCDVRIDNREVSRTHVAVSFLNNRWSWSDLSRNGVFVDGQPQTGSEITGDVTLSLGAAGPSVTLALLKAAQSTQPAPPAPPEEVESNTLAVGRYARRYFEKDDDAEAAGPRTLMIRQAFDHVLKKHRRRNNAIVAAVALLAATAAGFGYFKHLENVEAEKRQQELEAKNRQLEAELARIRAATEDFYSIKEKDVDLIELEQKAQSGDAGARTQREKLQAERLAQIRKNEAEMNELVYKNLGETDRLILRVTRRLGECELTAPKEYRDRVKRHIAQWVSTRRFTDALQRAQKFGYVDRITRELLLHDLSPDFFYLAMQESNFHPGAVGPKTRYGYAKGMWQFIPETGLRFGLKPGPFKDRPQPDAVDERQDWNRATTAAAKYIKEIYTTDAKTSGLLVMASYNWGEYRVIDRVRDLPPHPRDRNFWKLIERFKIPDETYNYVFNIIAAAVIGESPGTFGFDFPNPLAPALRQYETSR